MLKTIELIFIVLGLLLAFGGYQLNIPLLLESGIACFGLAMIALGWDGIITRQIVVGSRRRGPRRTYKGIAAVLQGVQFNVIGLFLVAIALVMFLNINGQSIGRLIAERPGIPLIVLGIIFLIQAAVLFIGNEVSDRSSVTFMLDLVVARLLPGLILVVLGLGAVGLGLFEITAPTAFDEMGGALLETLYGAR